MKLVVNKNKAIFDWIDQLNNDGFLNFKEKSKITILFIFKSSNFISKTLQLSNTVDLNLNVVENRTKVKNAIINWN